MRQVQTFTNTSQVNLDDEMNTWLKEAEYQSIIGDIKFSTSYDSLADAVWFSAQITYEPLK
jgi:hypothetical protein